MEHKVGDRVRIKQLVNEPDLTMLSGELGNIKCVHKYHGYTIETRFGSGNLFESQFINLEHLEVPETPEEDIVITDEIREHFSPPKQVSFNFTLPIETLESDLHFEIDGKEYSVMITRIK